MVAIPEVIPKRTDSTSHSNYPMMILKIFCLHFMYASVLLAFMHVHHGYGMVTETTISGPLDIELYVVVSCLACTWD